MKLDPWLAASIVAFVKSYGKEWAPILAKFIDFVGQRVKQMITASTNLYKKPKIFAFGMDILTQCKWEVNILFFANFIIVTLEILPSRLCPRPRGMPKTQVFLGLPALAHAIYG